MTELRRYPALLDHMGIASEMLEAQLLVAREIAAGLGVHSTHDQFASVVASLAQALALNTATAHK